MDVESRVKALMNEAEIYQTQGLLDEAKEKYDDATTLIRVSDELEDRETWLSTVSEKITTLGGDFAKLKQAARQPELSPKVQDLIKDLFSSPAEQDQDTAKLEGAIALAKFGQLERALADFKELIKKDSLRVAAAKNILRVHIVNEAFDEAVAQYDDWLSSDIVFTSQQFESIRIFLQSILDRKRVDKRLQTVITPTDAAAVVKQVDAEPDEGHEEEDFLDITFLGLTIYKGPLEGRVMEFDVNFQRGNIVSIIVSGRDKELVDTLEVGDKFPDLECSSVFAVFMASGVIAEKMRIDSGSKRGDFRVDIRIASA
ncbi:MAG: hypothetical protein JRI70_02290 [Deltaproteobacteria bacterium]|nr:hypothetical protein [Deltaproteobacteria bacterium]MBW2171380.1 hypothetical protein [Deltaproteobacteria bacterium]